MRNQQTLVKMTEQLSERVERVQARYTPSRERTNDDAFSVASDGESVLSSANTSVESIDSSLTDRSYASDVLGSVQASFNDSVQSTESREESTIYSDNESVASSADESIQSIASVAGSADESIGSSPAQSPGYQRSPTVEHVFNNPSTPRAKAKAKKKATKAKQKVKATPQRATLARSGQSSKAFRESGLGGKPFTLKLRVVMS